MRYVELTLKIPVPSRYWFRFRVRTLLLIMFIVALIFSGLRLHHDGEHARLMKNLTESKAARDTALQDWKQIHSAYLLSRASSTDEAEARSRYFKNRAVVEAAVQQVVRYEARYGEPSITP